MTQIGQIENTRIKINGETGFTLNREGFGPQWSQSFGSDTVAVEHKVTQTMVSMVGFGRDNASIVSVLKDNSRLYLFPGTEMVVIQRNGSRIITP